MEQSDIAGMLVMIASLYPNFSQADGSLKAWHWLFKEEAKEEVTRALKEVLKTSKFPPTPAEIFDMIRALRVKNLPPTLTWTPDEALLNANSDKYLCKISRDHADSLVPKINGKTQFGSVEEMHRSSQIRQREWDRAYKEKFKQLQVEAIANIKRGLSIEQSMIGLIQQNKTPNISFLLGEHDR